MNWQNKKNILSEIKSVNDFFAENVELFAKDDEIILVESSENAVAILRRGERTKTEILFVANYNPEMQEEIHLTNMEGIQHFECSTGKIYEVENGILNFSLNSFEYVIGFLKQSSKE
jgi:hypothetical protein